jgi:hypothetical protein
MRRRARNDKKRKEIVYYIAGGGVVRYLSGEYLSVTILSVIMEMWQFYSGPAQ